MKISRRQYFWLLAALLGIGLYFWHKPNLSPPTSSSASSVGSQSSQTKKVVATNGAVTQASQAGEPSASPSGAAQTPQARKPGAVDLEGFLNQADPDNSWTIHRNKDGRAFQISGGFITEQGDSAETALGFARGLAPYLSVSPEQVVVDEKFNQDNRNPLALTYSYRQVIDGYDVYGAALRMFVRASDNAIYFVNNSLKDIQPGRLEVVVSLSSAVAVVLKEYPNAATDPTVDSSRPLVFATGGGRAELVWRIVIQMKQPSHDRREILVSAVSGQKLQDKSLMVF